MRKISVPKEEIGLDRKMHFKESLFLKGKSSERLERKFKCKPWVSGNITIDSGAKACQFTGVWVQWN